MSVDWSKTPVGEEPEAEARMSEQALDALRLGRLAGIAGAALLLAGTFVALPGRFEDAVPLLIGLAGVLLGNVLGLVLLDRSGPRASLPALATGLCGVLATLQLSIAATFGMLAILACEWLWLRESKRARSQMLVAIPVGAFGLAGMMVLAIPASLSVAALMGLALVPLVVMAIRHETSGNQMRDLKRSEEVINRAFMEFALARLPKRQVMVDASGRLEPNGAGASFHRHLAGREEAGTNLVDRVLIADRPKVLQALSDVIHKSAAPLTLMARVQTSEERSPLAPPLFVAERLTIGAAPGIEGRAIILIEPAERRQRETGADGITEGPTGTIVDALARPAPDGELLARALHDCVAPFNAGLGYLEMVADQRLAPQDPALLRSYAREAMAAIREAHRNSSLMGRWLKLEIRAMPARAEATTFGELAGDAIRAMHLGADAQSVTLRLDPSATGLALSLSLDHARFAIAVYLRGLLAQVGKAGRITLHARFEQNNLRVVGLLEPTPQLRKGGDMFQLALERVALKSGDIRFEPGTDGSHSLMLAEVAVPGLATPVQKTPAQNSPALSAPAPVSPGLSRMAS